ncbi:MAG: MFS transporter [Elusimicrobiota bacterium]
MSTVENKTSRNIYILGFVSLFTDISTQMIYPLMPEFLVSLGASTTIIGVIEGIAESTASILRTIFGNLSDKLKKRKLFIFLGYGLSTLSKPFLFFANSWTTVLVVKFFDRTGKAMRAPSRDALISSSANHKMKGSAFGIHRAMDRTGALLGPLLALVILHFSSNNLRLVFILSVIPGIISVLFIKFAKEAQIESAIDSSRIKSIKSKPFIMFLTAITVFTLGNSSNVFLILKAREAGLPLLLIPFIWAVYNLFCSVTAPMLGSLSDKVGRRPIIIISFLYYALIYFLFGISASLIMVWILFCGYGVYYGLSEGIFRAYIADLIEPSARATAYGMFNTAIGLALFPASLIMGTMWHTFGSKYAFLLCSIFSLLGFLIFLFSSQKD